MAATRHGGLTVATAFFLVAIALSGVLPLWLDEIMQLRETRNTSPAQLIASLPRQPGAAPLGYLIQQTALHITGYSVRAARFPSALFVAGTVFVVALFAAELELKTPWLAAAIFSLFPLTLRYACESRVYSQALLFSALASLLFVRLVKNPGWLRTVLYAVALTAAVYTQPFAVFVGAAHLLWAIIYRERRVARLSATALALAVAAFLPWYFWTRTIWSAGIAGAGLRFTLSAKTPLMLFRELAGAGYWGSGLLLILCIVACTRREQSRNVRLLSLLIAVPILLALAADAVFGYFVATRQILWVLPAVAVFAAMAIERTPRIALPLLAIFAAISLWQSFHYFTAPREDWQLAANVISDNLRQGSCLVVVPKEQAPSYAFFRPDLTQSHCPSPRTMVAFTPYATKAQREAAVTALTTEGYTRQSATEAGKSEVSLFTR